MEPITDVGWGQLKVAFEIELPWGGRAVAKRCRRFRCADGKRIQKEAEILRKLQDQYGDVATRYYGECDAPYYPIPIEDVTDDNRREFNEESLKANFRNFSVGYTSVIEIGVPLVKDWGLKDRKCFAEGYTDTDLEDLRGIARRYANFSNGTNPILMGKVGEYSDNIHPQQYMVGVNDRKGHIQHVDLDTLIPCKRDQESHNGNGLPDDVPCTYETALAVNCRVMAELTNLQNLSCAVDAVDSDSAVPKNTDDNKSSSRMSFRSRINATSEFTRCKEIKRDIPKEEFKQTIEVDFENTIEGEEPTSTPTEETPDSDSTDEEEEKDIFKEISITKTISAKGTRLKTDRQIYLYSAW